jgi:serine protease AprX
MASGGGKTSRRTVTDKLGTEHMNTKTSHRLAGLMAALGALAAAPGGAASPAHHYIVEAQSAPTATRLVRNVGGRVARSLPIINAVMADLTPGQATALTRDGAHVYEDRAVTVSGSATSTTNSPGETYVATVNGAASPPEIGATGLQLAGTTGAGVVIAVLDTGMSTYAHPYDYDGWSGRVIQEVDFAASNGATGWANVVDGYGHGTQITSVMGSAAKDVAGLPYGVAPGAQFIIVRAFNANGSGSYSSVISGLNWIVAHQAKYNIRIVNLSLGATPQSTYWNDPLNQAVMKAWQAGIVVVAAAGNAGPAAQTIEAPGNVPYVITVGAMTDNYTPWNQSNWKLASFSSTGPTYEGFVKPEVVAPGGHVIGTMPNNTNQTTTLTSEIFGSAVNPVTLFPLSGTSQAAAVTSGAVALLLQSQPSLTPDQVKCKLMASAQPAVNPSNHLAYSIFQQGAGMINVLAANSTSALNCANQGLNIAADLAGTQHFGGAANETANGTYYIMNMQSSTPFAADPSDGYSWSNSGPGSQGYTWSQAYLWTKGTTWSQAYLWTKSYTWSASTVWSQAYLWTKSLPFNSASTPSPASLSVTSASVLFPAKEE